MNLQPIFLAIAVSTLLFGCGGGGSSTVETPAVVVPDSDPAPPVLGTQIDRMGRAAIATALVSPLADADTRGSDLDAYNAASQGDWVAFSDRIRASLAVYDGLDAMCGNQILADLGEFGPERYDAFTGALVDDRLYLNAASGACQQYLAVELDATGLASNRDCGGRTPLHDTVDVSYTALSNDLTVPVGDGVDADDRVASLNSFPFLAEFQPPPPAPALGVQIDRMGRAAIATALISPFDASVRDADLDAYNAAAEADWETFENNLRSNMAFYDGFDGMCGDQLLIDEDVTDPTRYDFLAGVLTDDRLYLNAANGNCSQYLAVEIDASGLIPNEDCGGRTLRYDTVDVSYTVLMNDLTVEFGDGVDEDDLVHFNTGFPFLVPPVD